MGLRCVCAGVFSCRRALAHWHIPIYKIMDIITNYFPGLSETQLRQYAALGDLYTEWNAKINVISRKDIGNLYEHHVLHSLGIAKVIHFKPGTELMDLGTGGGFPGIPLAILFPECRFHLVDSIGKKVRVAMEVAQSIGLENVTFSHARAEEIKTKYDFVVSRAVMPLPDLIRFRSAQCLAQWSALPERRRIGGRNSPLQAKGHGMESERLFRRRLFRD